jgi:hypothetical protein
LRVGFQEGLLGCVFNLISLAEEFAGDSKDSRAVSAQDLLERAFIALARLVYQLQVRSLFDLDWQSSS